MQEQEEDRWEGMGSLEAESFFQNIMGVFINARDSELKRKKEKKKEIKQIS